MSDDTLVLIVIAWLVSAIVGAIIGMQKGKAGKGAFLAFFFGPLGWLLMIWDVGIFPVVILVLLVGGVLVAGILASEKDKDRMQEIEREARRANDEYRRERNSGMFPMADGQ